MDRRQSETYELFTWTITQHSWVLKVSDPAVLAGIDSVFVTSEPLRAPRSPVEGN
jgi:hypothetical protein